MTTKWAGNAISPADFAVGMVVAYKDSGVMGTLGMNNIAKALADFAAEVDKLGGFEEVRRQLDEVNRKWDAIDTCASGAEHQSRLRLESATPSSGKTRPCASGQAPAPLPRHFVALPRRTPNYH